MVYMGGPQGSIAAAPPQPSTLPIPSAALDAPTIPPSPPPIAADLATPPPELATAATPAPRQQRGRGRGLLAIISAICIVALLATGSYFLFNLLNSHTENDVARVVPSDTVALVSIDLVAAAARGRPATTGDLGNVSGQSDTFKLLTGLDWTKDVLPWVGRDIAFAVFQREPPARSPNGGQGVSATITNDTVGGAFLLQSRDDGAAQAAMRKAAAYQQSHGSSLATLDYRGLKIYHTSLLQGDESGTTLVAGKGWVIVAGDLPAARELVNRLTGASGASDTLAENSAYRDALRTLPSNRFGTLYLDMRALVKGFIYGSNAQIEQVSAIVDTYPIAIGYLAWTSSGLRAQITHPAVRRTDVGSLSGDTTGLASLTPADAFAYAGVANLGATLRAQTTLMAQSKTETGTPTSLFGLVPTDPGLQQNAALSLIAEPKGATGYIVLLNAPDRADALAVIGQIATQQRWTQQTTTVAGVSVTAYYAPPPATQSYTDIATTSTTDSTTAHPVGLQTWLENTLIFASDPTAMTDAIHTIRDHSPNLAQNTAFQQLLHEAPQGAFATTFLDLTRADASGDAATTVVAGSLAGHVPAALITQVWNDAHYQTTTDLLLPK